MNNLFYQYLVCQEARCNFNIMLSIIPETTQLKHPLYYVIWVVCTELCWLSSPYHSPPPLHLVYHISYYVILFITNKVKCKHWIIISERRYIIDHAWNPLRPDAFIVRSGHSHWCCYCLKKFWSSYMQHDLVVRTVQWYFVLFLLCQLPWEDSTHVM